MTGFIFIVDKRGSGTEAMYLLTYEEYVGQLPLSVVRLILRLVYQCLSLYRRSEDQKGD